MNLHTNKKNDARETPWGAWATAGWGLLIGAVFILFSVLVIEGIVAIEKAMNLDIGIPAMAKDVGTNGFVIAVTTFITTPLCLVVIAVVVWLRRGPPVRRYLGFNAIAPRTILMWIGIVTIFALGSDALTRLLGRPLVSDFIVDTYATAYFAPLFWVALVIVAPLFEEVFFRGFLFEGFQHSRLRSLGAIFLTSLTWTMLHVQYDAYEISTIFLLGMVFGFARLKTRSVYPPLAMHSLFNLFAMVQVAAL